MSLLYSDMQRNACFCRRSSTRRLAGAAGQSSARAAAEAAAARVLMAAKSALSAPWPVAPVLRERACAAGAAVEVAGPVVT